MAIAAALVYVPSYLVVGYGRAKSGFDPRAPRAIFDKLPPYAQRATWAHQNAFESVTLFAPAAILVLLAQGASPYTSAVALTYLVARLVHSIAYIVGIAPLRSLAWIVSIGCIASLYGTAITEMGQ
ncbi:MAG: MAPEG family protein [Gloeomargarita sp. SKYG98]|nr:MAPEG family protein [Gloeomargarita sp. SKYG98]